MRARILIVSIALAVLLLAAAGAVYAYDRANAEKLGEGVKVGGVDVSGLTPEQARSKLRAAVLEPLSQPVVVRAQGRRYRLTPKSAKVRVNIDSSVDAALAESREGNVFVRTGAGSRGEPVDADLKLDIAYSKRGINRVVDRVQRRVDKPAIDAKVDLERGSIEPEPSEEGRQLRARRLARELRATLLDTSRRQGRAGPDPEGQAEGHRGRARRQVSGGRDGQPVAFQLTLYKKLKPVKTYGIAVGQVGLETPAGLYTVQNKAVNPAWSVPNSAWAGSLAGTVVPGGTPQNPLKARWLGIYNGAGIHGTDAAGSIGTAASHGCIRMLIPDVIELYDQVPVNAPVYIA